MSPRGTAGRRGFLRTAAAASVALATPRIARAADARTIRFVPYVDLSLLDPVVNTSTPARNHAFLVFDTLYGLDDSFRPQPQMVEGETVEDDGKSWRLRLREGLRFHDGEPVLAGDVVASVRRWAARDGFGQALMAVTDAIEAPSDREVTFRLRAQFPMLPDALGKISPNICPIMPQRLASTDPNSPVTEMIGSGPFKFAARERVAGSLAVYTRFENYVPRPNGTPSISAGPKIAKVDRVEWHTIPDAATAAAALQTGEVDWLEAPSPDLIRLLRQTPAIRVEVKDHAGLTPLLRFNCIQPPFDNPAVRRAVLRAVDQSQFMQAYAADPSMWHIKLGAFCPGTPMASDAGMAELFGATDIDRAKRELADGGYSGERVVLLAPADHPISGPIAIVAEDLFRRIGFSVDMQAMDVGTMNVRRNNRAPVDHGGWSCFPSTFSGVDLLNPAVSAVARGNGLAGYYGWPTSQRLEDLRANWMAADDIATRQRLAADIQVALWDEATYVPLGQIFQPQAYRDTLSGILPGFVKFYNVEKAE
jgi:peptide/nickel transport system substrate-binding protein